MEVGRGSKFLHSLLADEVDLRAGIVEGSESCRVAVGPGYVDINSNAEFLPFGSGP
jgi:hypothetical protein